MLFTRNLITKFIPEFSNISDEKLTQAVNSLGMEVESITKYPAINNCVVGQLISFSPIEGTHLNLCVVQTGTNETRQIVCGASGLIPGKKVIVALEGARLPNGITIGKRMIHNVESNGMMCAYSELTNNDDVVAEAEQDEIIMLDEGTVGDTNWQHLVGLDDTIYDITVPANRNDENCYLVFCYELAGKLNLPFKFNLKEIINKTLKNTGDVIVDKKICSCLCFLDYDLNNKSLTRSDWYLKSILMNHGVRPINQTLDKLAFITLLTNCPTHAYDSTKLLGNMQCKLSNNSIKFVALNSKTYTLNDRDVLIWDQHNPVSLACVIGSDNTKMTDQTRRIRIEVGNFNYAMVRNTALRLNVDTDASKKAAKKLSNFLNKVTIELIQKEFGQPIKKSVYFEPSWNNDWIDLSYETLAWFIAEPISKNFVLDSLKRLGFEVKGFNKNKFLAPAWRQDIQTQEDLFEEILKIIDINKLKAIAISDNLLPIADNSQYEIKQGIKDVLLNNFFSEVKTYNLTNKNNLDKFNLFNKTNPIKIICNNLNREYFRLSLIDNMIKVYQYNDARKLQLMPIFEIQNLFTNEYRNVNLTCLCLDQYKIDNITSSLINTNVNYLKAVVGQISNVLNCKLDFNAIEIKEFYNNESLAIIYQDNVIGYIGKIKQSVLKDYDLQNKTIYCLTMNLESLIKDYKPYNFQVKSFGVFQRLAKDVNATLDEKDAKQIVNILNKVKNIENVEDAEIINVFNKENRKIYTIRYYLSDKKQFNTTDIDAIARAVEKVLF